MIVDALSDEYGWCFGGFEAEEDEADEDRAMDLG
jgi:hypothetical protein